MSLFAHPGRSDKAAGDEGSRAAPQQPPQPRHHAYSPGQSQQGHRQNHHLQQSGRGMYYNKQQGGRHHHPREQGYHRGGGPGQGYQRHHHGGGEGYHRGGVVRVYDMRSLSAALEAAKPGCGEIRRILTTSAFRPRLPGLTKLVSRLSREGHWQKGLEVFEALPHMGLTPDTTITNAAISACDRGGQWERALHIFDDMDHHGLCRDTITYSSVISALSKGRQCNMAIEVFNHMMKAGVQPDAVTCCSLIAALDKGGMWQLAEQVFISMYADHPKFRVLLLMMDDSQLPPDLQGSASLPVSKDLPLSHFLSASSGISTMDRQYSTPAANFSTLETLHEGVAGSWSDAKKGQQGTVSPKLNRKAANRSPPPLPVRRSASAHGSYGHPELSPLQQLQKMEEAQEAPEGDGTAIMQLSESQAKPGAVQKTQELGSGTSLSRASGGSGLQKMDVVGNLALPSVDELQVDNIAELFAQMSASQGGSLPLAQGRSLDTVGTAIRREGNSDVAAIRAAAVSPVLVDYPVAVSPIVPPVATAASTGHSPQPISTPPPGSGRRSGPGRLSPQQGGRISPPGYGPGVTAKSPMMSAFANLTAPNGQQPALGHPGAPAQSNHISPFTKAKAIGDDIFGSATPPPGGSGSMTIESAFKSKPAEQDTVQHQHSMKADIRRALSGLTGVPELHMPDLSNEDMQCAMAGLQNTDQSHGVMGLDIQRAMSAMTGIPNTHKGMAGTGHASTDAQKADVLRTLSVNLDSMVTTQPQQVNRAGQPYQSQIGIGSGTVNHSPFGGANFQRSGFQSSGGMSRASSCPSPGVLLRTTSISNRKTAPNRVCCNALLAAYARANPPQWLKALRLLELMWECSGEVCPDIVSYNTVMKACGNAQQLDIAFEVYHSMRVRNLDPSIATFGTLITVASDAQRYDKVIEVWGWLQQSGLELNITCANAFLSALEKEGRWNDALEFFQSILSMSSKVRPNAVTFNIIMSSYQKRGQPDKVVFVFEDMFAASVDPSIVTYNTLISAYGQMGDWVKAMEVLQHLIQSDRGIHPTLATFNQVQAALSEGALRATDEEKHKIAECSWRVFQHMVTASGVQPDMVTYNTIITTLQRVGNTQMVRKLINIMNSGIVEGLRNPDSERLVPA